MKAEMCLNIANNFNWIMPDKDSEGKGEKFLSAQCGTQLYYGRTNSLNHVEKGNLVVG